MGVLLMTPFDAWLPVLVVGLVLLLTQAVLYVLLSRKLKSSLEAVQEVSHSLNTISGQLVDLKSHAKPEPADPSSAFDEVVRKIDQLETEREDRMLSVWAEAFEKLAASPRVQQTVATEPKPDPTEGWMALPPVQWTAPVAGQLRELAALASRPIAGESPEASILRIKIHGSLENLASAMEELSAAPGGQLANHGIFVTLIDHLYAGEVHVPLLSGTPELYGLVAAYDRVRANAARELKEKHGISAIRPIPMVESFDPAMHEGLSGSPGRAELPEHDGRIAELWRPGLSANGQVVEKARVRWLRYSPANSEPTGSAGQHKPVEDDL
ncbi:MAG TPA: hypothetical protein VGE01_02120 [Fimbriimonas sp.]